MPGRAPIPPELQLRSRRIQSRSSIGERLTYLFLGLFILPHTLIGVGFLLAMPGSIIWALLGEDHAARVERLRSTRQKGGRAYHVAYSYDLPSSRERRHAETTIRQPLYSRLDAAPPEARSVSVRSLGSAPPLFYDDVSEDTPDTWRKVGFVWVAGSFWCGVLSVFVYMIYLDPWLTRRLYRLGTPVAGSLVAKCTSTSRKSGVTSYHLTFSYRTPDGATRQREMIAHRNTNPESAHLHEAVTVLYDPERPKRSIAYEYGPYRCLDV